MTPDKRKPANLRSAINRVKRQGHPRSARTLVTRLLNIDAPGRTPPDVAIGMSESAVNKFLIATSTITRGVMIGVAKKDTQFFRRPLMTTV